MNGAVLVVALIFLCGKQEKDAKVILKTVDNVINAPKDQEMKVRTTLIAKNGKESIREMNMWQKGSNMRLVKFLSPADQKGIGLLSLPNDNITVYLPAFGKTKKIASGAKTGKFAGTDFTIEDMEAKNYSEKWSPALLRTEDNNYILELKPLPNIKTEYSKLIMTVRTSDNYPIKIEHYDKGGKLIKILASSKIETKGKYIVSRELLMSDLRTGTKTKLEILTYKYDSGLSDEIFTERNLIK